MLDHTAVSKVQCCHSSRQSENENLWRWFFYCLSAAYQFSQKSCLIENDKHAWTFDQGKAQRKIAVKLAQITQRNK